jgi:hypothetical protein
MHDVEERLAADLADAARAASVTPPELGAIAAGAARRRRRRRARTGALAVAATVLVAAGAVAVVGTANRDDTVVGDQPTTTTTPTTDPTTAEPEPFEPPVTSLVEPPAVGVPVAENLTLRPDGLGAFDFGAPMAEVMAEVVATLGEPRRQPRAEGVTGCAPYMADAVWTSGLSLTFEGTSWETLGLTSWFVSDSLPEFTTHRFRTAEGAVLGADLATWRAVYGTALTVSPEGDDPAVEHNVTIDLPGGQMLGWDGAGAPLAVRNLGLPNTCSIGD